MNARISPSVTSPSTPSRTPAVSTPALARPAARPPIEKVRPVIAWAARRRPPVVLDRGVDPVLGALLDRVRPDHLRADHRLGDRGQHVADLRPDHAVRRGHQPLQVLQAGEQRDEADQHDQRELPGVDEHDHGREQHLPDADQEDEPAELQELRHRVHVRRDPADQRAAPLGALGQHRQVVHVPERLDPHRRQTVFGVDREPHGREVRRDGGDQNATAQTTHIQTTNDMSGPPGPDSPLSIVCWTAIGTTIRPPVMSSARSPRDPPALTQLGRDPHALPQRLHPARVVAVVEPAGLRRAHAEAPSASKSSSSAARSASSCRRAASFSYASTSSR